MSDNYNENNNRRQGGNNPQDPKKQNWVMRIVAALISLFLVLTIMNVLTGRTEEEISYSDFITMLDSGKIESVEITSDRIHIIPKTEKSRPSLILTAI